MFGLTVTALLSWMCMLSEHGVWWGQREVMGCV
jgi:hypothetical protein